MSVENKPGSSFEDLLKSLSEVAEESETLAKSAAAEDDATVAAAAEDSGVVVPGDDADLEDEDEAEEGETIAKSDDMVDATDLLKSMLSRQEGTDAALTKALTVFTGALSKQNALIKSLQSEVSSLRSQGRGRKTMLNVSEKPPIGDLAKSAAAEEGKISPQDLLAKSQQAFSAGKLSGVEANTVDVCLRNGWSIDPGILAKVAAA